MKDQQLMLVRKLVGIKRMILIISEADNQTNRNEAKVRKKYLRRTKKIIKIIKEKI